MGRIKSNMLIMACTECKKNTSNKQKNYYTRLGKSLRTSFRQANHKMQLMKFCKVCKTHTSHEELKS